MQRKFRGLAIAALLVAVSGLPLVALAQSAPKRIEISASQFSFSPGEITLKKGQPVILVLKSQDVAHGLRVRELNLAVKVNDHGTAQAQFTPQKTGDFVGHCYVFCGRGHGSMVLTFHVVD
jgi:cytochrome c oxidase subunit 2